MSHDEIQAALTTLLGTFGEHRARELLSAVARPAVVSEFERAAALDLALRMRETQAPRQAIRDRLELRGLSRATAYRVICRAIDVPPPNCLTDGPTVRRDPPTFAMHADLANVLQLQLKEQPMTDETNASTTTLLVEITALRAPWPTGAVIGSIVEIPSDSIPDSFVGKCRPADPGAKVTHVYEPPRKPDAVPDVAIDLAEIFGDVGNVDFLTARRDELRARLAAIDLPAARTELELARAAARASPGDVPPVSPPGAGEWPEQTARRLQYERAAHAVKAALGRIRQLEADEREYRSELAYVEGLLNAEKHVEEAKAAAQAADVEHASLEQVAGAADAALTRIVDLIADEERAYAKARDAAGASVLEAVKAGGASVPLKAASRDKIATLEVAKSGAEQEQKAARTAHQQAQQARREAWHLVRVAEAVVAERAFRQAERDYVEALARATAAKAISREGFSVADPRQEAVVRSQRIVQSMGG